MARYSEGIFARADHGFYTLIPSAQKMGQTLHFLQLGCLSIHNMTPALPPLTRKRMKQKIQGTWQGLPFGFPCKPGKTGQKPGVWLKKRNASNRLRGFQVFGQRSCTPHSLTRAIACKRWGAHLSTLDGVAEFGDPPKMPQKHPSVAGLGQLDTAVFCASFWAAGTHIQEGQTLKRWIVFRFWY